MATSGNTTIVYECNINHFLPRRARQPADFWFCFPLHTKTQIRNNIFAVEAITGYSKPYSLCLWKARMSHWDKQVAQWKDTENEGSTSYLMHPCLSDAVKLEDFLPTTFFATLNDEKTRQSVLVHECNAKSSKVNMIYIAQQRTISREET